MSKKQCISPLKKGIKGAHTKAQWVGFFYLLANVALLALTLLPFVEVPNAGTYWTPVIYNFFGPIVAAVTGAEVLGINYFTMKTFYVSAVYALLVIMLVINVIASFTKLGWLYKKSASAKYGFNRPEYAMEDLGRLFSWSFAAWVVSHAVIMVIGARLNEAMALYAYIALGVAVVLHIWLGLVGGNVTLYEVTPVGVRVDQRRYGRFSVFLRNVFQIAAVGAIIYFMVQVTTMGNAFRDIAIGVMTIEQFLANINLVIACALELLTLIFWVVLAKHATGITEFDRDGKKAPGMKNFAVFSILIFVCMGGLVVWNIVNGLAIEAVLTTMFNEVIVAGVALVAFIIELIMCKFPKVKKSILKQEAAQAAAMEEAKKAPVRTGIGFNCINKPGVINQGGHEYMVMPLGYNQENVVEEDELYNYDFCFEGEEA